jgi:hypothetical protein
VTQLIISNPTALNLTSNYAYTQDLSMILCRVDRRRGWSKLTVTTPTTVSSFMVVDGPQHCNLILVSRKYLLLEGVWHIMYMYSSSSYLLHILWFLGND